MTLTTPRKKSSQLWGKELIKKVKLHYLGVLQWLCIACIGILSFWFYWSISSSKEAINAFNADMISNCEALVRDYSDVNIDDVPPIIFRLSNGLYAQDTVAVSWVMYEWNVNVLCEGHKNGDDFVLVRLLSGEEDLTSLVKREERKK